MKSENYENPMQLSLLNPAIDALCAFSLFGLFISPLWVWLTDNNHALQSVAYLCTIVAGCYRGSVWLRRYLQRRSERKRYLIKQPRKRWFK